MKKISLLKLLEKYYPETESERLYSAVLCGDVFVEGEKVRNPKEMFSPDSMVVIESRKFVSRGGFKLEKALTEWNIDVKGKMVLDAGSSTGGFTDCLLQHGASLVHAVDSGFNQLDFTLRQNPRVVVHEKTNIMDVEMLEPMPQLSVADLSFRSITGAASRILSLTEDKFLIALIKPQFEERGLVKDFDGIIRRTEDLKKVLTETVRLLFEEGSYVAAITESPFRGTKGNREFLSIITGREQVSFEEISEKIGQIR